MIAKYMLIGKKIIKTYNLLEWANWFESRKRRSLFITYLPGRVRVSTVFLSLDHGWDMHATPLLFETMIFGGKYDLYQERYYTFPGAKAGHYKAAQMAKQYKRSRFNKVIITSRNRYNKLPYRKQWDLQFHNKRYK